MLCLVISWRTRRTLEYSQYSLSEYTSENGNCGISRACARMRFVHSLHCWRYHSSRPVINRASIHSRGTYSSRPGCRHALIATTAVCRCDIHLKRKPSRYIVLSTDLYGQTGLVAAVGRCTVSYSRSVSQHGDQGLECRASAYFS